MARVNYQREKRLKDLERQRKQEEKRNRKLQKAQEPVPAEDQGPGGEVEEQAPSEETDPAVG